MQAFCLTKNGKWAIENIPKPQVGDDDVLIQVKAVGICGSDLGILNGFYPLKGHTVMGHEFSGIIAEKGKNVTDGAIGDRVVQENTASVCGTCHLCATGRFLECANRQMIGGERYPGAFAEYVRIPGEILKVYPASMFHIPEGISFEAASIIDPLANGYKAIIQQSNLLPGETIVVFGMGAIGLSCVMMASVAGAGRIIAVDVKKDSPRLKMARKLGATNVIAMEEVKDVDAEILAVAGKDGVAVSADCAADAADVIHRCIEVTRNGGQVLSIGMSRKPFEHSLVNVGLKNLSLIGHMGYDNISWRNVIALMEKGRINAGDLISHVLPLSKFAEGLDLINKGNAVKVVLHPGE